MANEFIIKINKDSNGKELSLDGMPIEAIEALNIFLESLSDFASLYKKDNIRFSLRNGCIETAISYPETDNKIGKEIEDILNGKSTSNAAIKAFKNIQEKVKLNGLDYSILHKVKGKETNYTNVFKSKNFVLKRGPRTDWSEEILFIEGELFENGGKVRTNLHVTDVENNEYKIECTIDESKELKNCLHEKVYLSVLKKSKLNTKSYYHFIDTYFEESYFKKYKKLYYTIAHEKSLKKYDLVHDNLAEMLLSEETEIEDVVKFMKLFNYDSCDRGILRTILMATKPYKKQNKEMEIAFNTLSDILREGSQTGKI